MKQLIDELERFPEVVAEIKTIARKYKFGHYFGFKFEDYNRSGGEDNTSSAQSLVWNSLVSFEISQ
jgi:hypothetical protein